MLAKERQDRIGQLLRKSGAVTTAQLVREFNISVETVRRDLLQMEQKGLLARVHGGAVPVGEMRPFADLQHRNQDAVDQKRELAALAAACVQEGDHIAVDTGSTAIFFAEALAQRLNRLTVVTHSCDVFEILRDHGEFKVILCGGQYERGENAFCGSLTTDCLNGLRVQKAFIFPSAVSLEHGLCDFSGDFLQIQRKLLQITDQVYVLADSAKFEGKALMKLEEMRPEFTYVTDSLLPMALKKLYEENGLRIINGGQDDAKADD